MFDLDGDIVITASLQSPNVFETSTRPALVIVTVNAKIGTSVGSKLLISLIRNIIFWNDCPLSIDKNKSMM